MKTTYFFILFYLLTLTKKNIVFSLGEQSNFTELLNMVLGNISAAESYAIPQDNSNLLRTSDSTLKDYGTYDFIIIGAGAAGSVIANRLSEMTKWRILLLEAGSEDNDFTKILGLGPYSLHSDFNWGYNTTVQENACLGMQNKRCHIGQGKVVGGGTTINAAIYARGHPEDFNRWVNVYGNPGWSYDEVLPYFMKSENAVFSPKDSAYHGIGGYMTINHTNETPGLEEVLINGFKEKALYYVDYNGQLHNGISKTQFALNGNERVSTATAFLKKFKCRRNLKVSLNSFVTQILINGNDRAYGVNFIKNGQSYVVKAKKEVILSAGAINSAQLLMLSGIGPKTHLQELGIPVKKDLPVGKNFQDHVMFIGLYFRTKKLLYNLTLADQLKLYVDHLRPLTAGIYCEMVGFTNFGQTQTQRPKIEYMFSVPGLSSDQAKFSFMLDDNYTAAFKTNPATDIWVNVILLHPKSRGYVTLKSRNPKDKPNINPNYFSNQDDIETMYKGVQFLIELNNTQAFRNYGAEIVIFDYPGCEDFEKLTKEWWICAIKHLSTTIYHPASSNRMGPDPNISVVNANLKVHGLKSLRVADGSVLPEMNSGHTMAPIIMIGEKVSDMIKEKYANFNKLSIFPEKKCLCN